jgi:integrase
MQAYMHYLPMWGAQFQRGSFWVCTQQAGDCAMHVNTNLTNPHQTGRKPRLPGYRLHRASGNARVTLGGRDVYLGQYGSPESKSEYQRVLAEWLATGCRPLPSPGHSLTVIELLDFYLRDLQSQNPSVSQWNRARQAAKLLRTHCGHSPVDQISVTTIRAIQRGLVGRGNNIVTIRMRVSGIISLLRWGKTEGYVPIETFERIRDIARAPRSLGASPARIREPLGDEELLRAIEVMPPMLADMVTLQRYTGMRPGEVCRMKWRDISRSMDVCWLYSPPEHKTAYQGKKREIPLGRLSQAILIKYMDRPADAPLFCPRESEKCRLANAHEKRLTPMTPSQEQRAARARAGATKSDRGPGEGWRTDSYRRAIQRCLERAGLTKWFPYLLRHARATELRATRGLDAAQVSLGHSQVRTTERYAQPDAQLLQSVAS